MMESIGRNAGWARFGHRFEIFALVLVAFFWLTGSAAAEQGKVAEAIGKVEIGRGSPPKFADAKNGDPIAPGDVVRTGRGGRAELQIEAGTVRLYENSLLRIPADTKLGHQIELKSGRSIFDVIKRSVNDRFEIRAPEVVVSVKGTRFEVNLVGELAEISVFRGTVGVRAPLASLEFETLVREGFAATGAADVPFELEFAPSVDPWDSWATIARAQEITLNRGRTERGVQLREAAQAAARRSSDEQLVGIAAKRNPEVARRIEKMRKERTAANGKAPTQAPAALNPAPEMAPRGAPGRRRAMMSLEAEGFAAGLDGSEIAKQIEADREKFSEISLIEEQQTGGTEIEVPDDPGSTGVNGGWDPTPQLSMMEVASLQTGMSYEDLITVWYGIVQDLQVNQSTVFANADPSMYEAALEQKLTDIGLDPMVARSIVDYIISQIQK